MASVTVTRTLKARYLEKTYKARYLQISYSAKLTNVYFTVTAGIPYAIPHIIP